MKFPRNCISLLGHNLSQFTHCQFERTTEKAIFPPKAPNEDWRFRVKHSRFHVRRCGCSDFRSKSTRSVDSRENPTEKKATQDFTTRSTRVSVHGVVYVLFI